MLRNTADTKTVNEALWKNQYCDNAPGEDFTFITSSTWFDGIVLLLANLP